MLSCKLPLHEKIVHVALTQFPCKISNSLSFKAVPAEKERKKLVTVCVKPLEFSEDISQKLVQWIEMIKIMGADKIEIYVKKVIPKVLRILKW